MEKLRSVQEYVPGKQVTLAHLIAHPDSSIYKKLGLVMEKKDAIGILTITPGEAAEIGFLDRFSGTLVITGDVSSVECSLRSITDFLKDVLKFSTFSMTRS